MSWYRFQRRMAPYIFLSPFILLFVVFGLYPLVKSLFLSFYITVGPGAKEFVGLENYRFMLTSGAFRTAVINTLVFTLCSLFLQLPLSLGLALLLNSRLVRGRGILRLVFFSPNLVGQVFVAILFSVIFVPHFGMLNRALHLLIGLDLDTHWLGDPRLVMPAIVLASLWMYVGFNMVYFLAALQAVDAELYEAAQVDGAGALQQLRHVTLPSIRHVAMLIVVMSIIGSFQLFELPYVMLRGPGPDDAGLTVVMHLFLSGFGTGDLGYAAAVGWMLAAGVFLFAMTQMVLSGIWRRHA